VLNDKCFIVKDDQPSRWGMEYNFLHAIQQPLEFVEMLQ